MRTKTGRGQQFLNGRPNLRDPRQILLNPPLLLEAETPRLAGFGTRGGIGAGFQMGEWIGGEGEESGRGRMIIKNRSAHDKLLNVTIL